MDVGDEASSWPNGGQAAADLGDDRGTLALPPEAWEEFVAALDRDPAVPFAIRELLSSPSALDT